MLRDRLLMAGIGEHSAPAELRAAARSGAFCGLTTGLAPGSVQVNLAILPAHHAKDFIAYCRANAAACPVLAVGEPGDPSLAALGGDIDVRTDCPSYRFHVDGRHSATVPDIKGVWRDDLVSVAICCWFSMEDALRRANVRLRHLEMGIQGPLMRTNRPTNPVGPFRGPLVVSMRPFPQEQVETVKAVTARFPRVHGAPIHEGDPAALGISGFDHPDFGEPMEVLPGEVPLYWGCGLTALAALERARIPFFITHAAGSMLMTDMRNSELEESAS
jgi:uncharacterized protein YcsI (UPF0317 family)